MPDERGRTLPPVEEVLERLAPYAPELAHLQTRQPAFTTPAIDRYHTHPEVLGDLFYTQNVLVVCEQAASPLALPQLTPIFSFQGHSSTFFLYFVARWFNFLFSEVQSRTLV